MMLATELDGEISNGLVVSKTRAPIGLESLSNQCEYCVKCSSHSGPLAKLGLHSSLLAPLAVFYLGTVPLTAAEHKAVT